MKEMGFDEGADGEAVGGEAAEEGITHSPNPVPTQSEGPVEGLAALGFSAQTPKKGASQKYKMGDSALRLDVAHLNAFLAMEATMKEMGFEEGGKVEGTEEGEEGEEGSEEGAESEEPSSQAGTSPQSGTGASVTSSPNDPSHKYKAGDQALRLDVIHLNAHEAMEATMKEMGFEEGGQGEEGEEGEEGEGDQGEQSGEHVAATAVAAQPPTGGGGGSSKRAQVQPTSSRPASRHVAFVPDPYRQEPPDFEPPPKQRCFQEEEEGAGRRTQIATVAVRAPQP